MYIKKRSYTLGVTVILAITVVIAFLFAFFQIQYPNDVSKTLEEVSEESSQWTKSDNHIDHTLSVNLSRKYTHSIINIRAGRSTDYKVIKQISKDEIVYIAADSTSNGWTAVYTNRNEFVGYVSTAIVHKYQSATEGQLDAISYGLRNGFEVKEGYRIPSSTHASAHEMYREGAWYVGTKLYGPNGLGRTAIWFVTGGLTTPGGVRVISGPSLSFSHYPNVKNSRAPLSSSDTEAQRLRVYLQEQE